jgi:hypothetical protein
MDGEVLLRNDACWVDVKNDAAIDSTLKFGGPPKIRFEISDKNNYIYSEQPTI